MSVSISSQPSQSWVAINNPVVFKFTCTSYSTFENYRVELLIKKASSSDTLVQSLYFSPDKNGQVEVNLSEFLKPFVRVVYTPYISSTPAAGLDYDASIDFFISYREVYTGSATSFANSSTFYGLLATRYFNERTCVMTEYLPIGAAGKKVLSERVRLKLYRGYPLTVSYIPLQSGSLLKQRVTFYNQAGSVVSTTTTDTAITYRIIRGYIGNATTQTTAVSGKLEVLSNDLSTLYYSIDFDIVEPCLKNFLYLTWRNRLGGDEYFAFQYAQDVERFIENGRRKIRYTCYAENISAEEVEILQFLLSGNNVYTAKVTDFADMERTDIRLGQQVYILQPDGSKLGVIAEPQSVRYNNKDSKFSLRVNISYETW